MENSNSALASLTATYTDSEGEADDKYDDEVIDDRSDVSADASPAPVSFLSLFNLKTWFLIFRPFSSQLQLNPLNRYLSQKRPCVSSVTMKTTTMI